MNYLSVGLLELFPFLESSLWKEIRVGSGGGGKARWSRQATPGLGTFTQPRLDTESSGDRVTEVHKDEELSELKDHAKLDGHIGHRIYLDGMSQGERRNIMGILLVVYDRAVHRYAARGALLVLLPTHFVVFLLHTGNPTCTSSRYIIAGPNQIINTDQSGTRVETQ